MFSGLKIKNIYYMSNMDSLADELSTKIEHMFIRLNTPGPEEADRAAIWLQAALKSEITIFDLDDVFGRLKEASCARTTGTSWFKWIQWVFWGPCKN